LKELEVRKILEEVLVKFLEESVLKIHTYIVPKDEIK